MNRTPNPIDESWEHDPVWNLLDQAPPATPSPRFLEQTVRAARLADPSRPGWHALLRPAPLAGFAAAAAAVALAVLALQPAGISTPPVAYSWIDSPQAVAIQDIAETEALIAAVDQLDDFSDTELVSLIGF